MSGIYSSNTPVDPEMEAAEGNEGLRGRGLALAGLALAAALSWLVLIYLSAELGSPAPGASVAPEWGLYSALLFAAPALTFLPVGWTIGSRFLPVRAGIALGAFGFLLTFVDPGTVSGDRRLAVAVFAVALFGVLAVVLTPIAYAFGHGLPAEGRLWRARREGILAAAAISLGVGMSAIGVLNWIIWALLVVVVAGVRALLISRQA